MFRWLKRLFGYEISLNRVHDRFTVREGNERIEIRVDSDPRLMVWEVCFQIFMESPHCSP